MPGLQVTIDFNFIGPEASNYYDRALTLSAPGWSAPIGRSTSSSQGPQESGNNAWFSSRVVSRNHALLRADPVTREITLEDVDSMHGTHLAGRRLSPGAPERIFEGDVIRFGAEVERANPDGAATTFKPVEVEISYTWSDGVYEPVRPPITQDHARNSFSADYSDDDPASPYESDDLASRSPSVEVLKVTTSRNAFSVPESDVSDDVISILSDEDEYEYECEVYSPTSSPLGSNDHIEEKKPGDNTVGDEKAKATYFSSPPLKPTPVEGNSDEDLYYQDLSIFDRDVGGQERPAPEQDLKTTAELQPNLTVEITAPDPQDQLAANNRAVREPSPSDAAMVKPASSQRSPPFSQHLSSLNDARADFLGSASGSSSFSSGALGDGATRNDNAWAGHNSVLYESMPISPYVVTRAIADYYCSPGPATTNLFSSSYHIAPEASIFTEDVLRENPELLTRPVYDDYDGARGPYEHSAILDDEFDGTDRIEMFHANATIAHQTQLGRKRKAGEIDAGQGDSKTAQAETITPLPATNSKKGKERASILTESHTQTLDTNHLRKVVDATADIDNIESPPLPAAITTEPPRKKAKKNKEDSGARETKRGSSFAKFAAATMTGVAIGAVGTVLGLCSLPADFFS